MGGICKGPNKRNNYNNDQIQKDKIDNKNNQIYQTNKNQNQPINNINNNIIPNKGEDNSIKMNNTNNNINKPVIQKYDPKLIESTNTQMSNASSNSQVEIILNGAKNSQYLYQSGDIDNNNLKEYFKNKNKYSNLNDIPLSESSVFNNQYINNSDTLNENNPGNLNKTQKPILPTMQSQNLKYSQNNFNNENRVKYSLDASGTYIYYPRGDNTPLPDLQNMSGEF
jgi:hypothetical protein